MLQIYPSAALSVTRTSLLYTKYLIYYKFSISLNNFNFLIYKQTEHQDELSVNSAENMYSVAICLLRLPVQSVCGYHYCSMLYNPKQNKSVNLLLGSNH